jgi:hypothetical protein
MSSFPSPKLDSFALLFLAAFKFGLAAALFALAPASFFASLPGEFDFARKRRA